MVASKKGRRFSEREVTEGEYKGSLHVPSESYTSFWGGLNYLGGYLNERLLSRDPEEVLIAGIMLNLQNIVEYALELIITDFVAKNNSAKNQSFIHEIQTGFVSFKRKFTLARSKRLICKHEHDVMEQIRIIRNAQAHIRPTAKRVKYNYFGRTLFTRAAMIELFTDVNDVVRKLRSASGNKEQWPVIPPGYAEEMGWPHRWRGKEVLSARTVYNR